jgi:uncharacterized protein YkwD
MHKLSIEKFRNVLRTVFFASAVILLAACGGGGGGGAVTADPVSANTTAALPTPTSSVGTGSFTTTAPQSTPTTLPSAPVTAAAQSCNLPNFSQELLDRINAERRAGASCGGQARPAVAVLSWSTALTEAARLHSQDMITRNFFSHTNPSGQGVGNRVQAQGYTWSAVGENIAAGQSSVRVVMDGWMASSGHCNNIMSSNYTEVGVACVLNANDPNNYRYYWTMVLARPQ